MSDQTATAIADAPAAADQGKAPVSAAPVGIPEGFKDKIVINGQEKEVTYDELKNWASKAQGAEERFKYANQVLQSIKNNPLAALTNPALGIDQKAIAFGLLDKMITSEADKEALGKWFYEKVVVPAQMSPEERENLSNKEKAELWESEKKSKAAAELKAKEEENTKAHFQRILGEIAKEIPTSGLPFSPELKTPNDANLIHRIARKLELGLNAEREVSVKEAIQLVKADLRAEHNSMARLYNEDTMSEFYDADVMEKFNKAMLKKFKAGEKEKAKAAADKAEPIIPRADRERNKSREATRNAEKLMRQISTGKF
jgi:hypothetical protein